MRYHELLLKFLEGIQGGDVRSDIIATFGLILEAYRIGRIGDEELKKDLKELCLDILVSKYPLKSVEELREEAEEWAEKFYRVFRFEVIRDRYMGLLPP